jgi:crotonobetainyl-CoA:carnitine CoA-transferase CaiB-like acyl-CoA transferase
MMLEVEQRSGKVKILGFPVKMSETPAAIRRPAPQLGQNTTEILGNLGYSTEQIDQLKAKGVI